MGRGIFTCTFIHAFALWHASVTSAWEAADGDPHATVVSHPRNTHVVGSQRHAASAAGAEFGAAVGAEVAAPISKLCFVTDATSRSIVFVLALVAPCFFPYFSHLFLIAFKLLMQSPGKRENGSKLNKWWKTKRILFFPKQNRFIATWTKAKHTKQLLH